MKEAKAQGLNQLKTTGEKRSMDDVVIIQTISLRARLQPLGVGIHTHSLLI